MKTRKILALVLSLVMVFSLCSTALAAYTQEQLDANGGLAKYEQQNSDVSMYLATQGYTLLENNGILPLKYEGADKVVALFGNAAETTIKGGTGSGRVNNRANDHIDEALVAAGWTLANPTWLARIAEQGEDTSPKTDIAITDEELAEAKAATDFAIYAIARQAGENNDRRIAEGNGSYMLTDVELENVKLIAKNFENFVFVFNTMVMDTSWMAELGNDGLDAVVYMANGGQRGSEALVKVLEGEVTPSGKLTDTWPVNYEDYPSADSFSINDGNTATEIYEDGIYVGYRYFDTFGLDVSYEFGYGMSYTEFDIDVCDATMDEESVTVTVKVTNIGDTYSGKEVVQVYFSAPDGELEKPYQELAAYGKTNELAPGASQTMKLSYTTTDMSSFSEERAAYIMEEGQYIVRVGNSSRNTVVAATATLDKTTVIEQLVNQLEAEVEFEEISKAGKTPIKNNDAAEIPEAPAFALEGAKLPTVDNSEYLKELDTETVTTYLFEEDAKNYKPREEITLQTKQVAGIVRNRENQDPRFNPPHRPGWNGNPTYDESNNIGGYSTTTYSEVVGLVDALGTRGEGGEQITRENAKLTDVYFGYITLEQLVACMTAQELARLCVGGAGTVETNPDGTMIGGSASSVSGGAGQTTQALYQTRHVPAMPNADGPAGVRINQSYEKDGVTYYQYCTAFPAGVCLAMTWDSEALLLEGVSIGNEMVDYGVTTWLAPGMNIHRNALNGRNFEYYSEDPLVTGVTASYITYGVQQSSGIGVTIKHLWGNSQEICRNTLNNVIGERAAREIYLKGFEIAVKLAQPMCIMTSYNENNGWPAGDSYDVCTDLARGEWGFKGYIMTDWGGGQSTQYLSMHAGNDLIMPGGNAQSVLNGYTEQPTFNADGSIKTMGALKIDATSNNVVYTVSTTAKSESELPDDLKAMIASGEAEYSNRSGNSIKYYGSIDFSGQGRGTIALGDLQKSAIAVLNVALQSQDMEKMLADDLFGNIEYTAGSYSENNGALISEGWTMAEKGDVTVKAVKIETVKADGDETEVGVYYLGNEEISSILMTINSELAIKSVKTQDGATVVNNNGKVVVWTTGTLDTSKPVLTIVVDTADAKAGTYAITGTVEQLINSDAELIATVPVIAGAVTVAVAGDVDGDGIVTTTDLVMIARYLVDLEELTAEQLAVADVDGDGFVTASDLVSIARSIVA